MCAILSGLLIESDYDRPPYLCKENLVSFTGYALIRLGELSSEWGELSSEYGASCLLNVGRVVLGRDFFGASCLGRVVLGASCTDPKPRYACK